MSLQAVLAPVFVLVALTFVLLFVTGATRFGAVRERKTRVADIALGQPNWPDRVTHIGNSLNNQFQLPLLFYVLVILAIIVHKADLAFVGLSWVFVLTRIVHAGVHITTNHMGRRFTAFLIGACVLAIMWLIFAARVLFAI